MLSLPLHWRGHGRQGRAVELRAVDDHDRAGGRGVGGQIRGKIGRDRGVDRHVGLNGHVGASVRGQVGAAVRGTAAGARRAGATGARRCCVPPRARRAAATRPGRAAHAAATASASRAAAAASSGGAGVHRGWLVIAAGEATGEHQGQREYRSESVRSHLYMAPLDHEPLARLKQDAAARFSSSDQGGSNGRGTAGCRNRTETIWIRVVNLIALVTKRTANVREIKKKARFSFFTDGRGRGNSRPRS